MSQLYTDLRTQPGKQLIQHEQNPLPTLNQPTPLDILRLPTRLVTSNLILGPLGPGQDPVLGGIAQVLRES